MPSGTKKTGPAPISKIAAKLAVKVAEGHAKAAVLQQRAREAGKPISRTEALQRVKAFDFKKTTKDMIRHWKEQKKAANKHTVTLDRLIANHAGGQKKKAQDSVLRKD